MFDVVNRLWFWVLRRVSGDAYLEVVYVLTALRDTNAEIFVLLEGKKSKFSSRIRAIDPLRRVLVIDSPPVDYALGALYRGQRLTVDCSLTDRFISFQSKFFEPFLPDPNMGFQIRVPLSLVLKQPPGNSNTD